MATFAEPQVKLPNSLNIVGGCALRREYRAVEWIHPGQLGSQFLRRKKIPLRLRSIQVLQQWLVDLGLRQRRIFQCKPLKTRQCGLDSTLQPRHCTADTGSTKKVPAVQDADPGRA